MIRNIVHYQNNAARWIAIHQQMFDERKKSLAVLPISHLPTDFIGVPTIGSQDMAMLFGAWLQRWNDLLLTLLHPTRM
jgi:hypothetical protein